ncbi:hypothetical protein ASE36_18965 [Rhizobium sp. Root274]|uniref:winged helix-turn-helix domain-containing protein n=1 Tax=unclassified Rhizobium TaxID=2613769 RepID=UPI0007139363|nr:MULTISPECIES: winged helix-turn-helix domain-containing protein [unclassified Rhizobium]KQW27037.1 hypothetical protein ASC71_20110 [Rhizobium sp. Root1240]KRD27901.1 hypothetical protein ASE36_18965 [Rhizobium sp. Root274]
MTAPLPSRSEWLDAIARDPMVSPTAFRAAFALSRMVRANGKLSGRMVEIAAACGTSETTCRSMVFRLAERGYLSCKLERGRVTIQIAATIPKRKLSAPVAA